MKKIIIALLLTVASSALAQEGEVRLGPVLGFGTKSELATPSVGIKLNYGVTNRIELSPAFDYYIKNKGVSAWDLNLNAHYVFTAVDDLFLYPLVGLSLFHDAIDATDLVKADANTRFGLNLGGGIRYNLTESISLGLELKYVLVSRWGGLNPSLNLMFRL